MGAPETGAGRTAAEVKLAPLKLELAAEPESMVRTEVLSVPEIRLAMPRAVEVVPVNVSFEAEGVAMEISPEAGAGIARMPDRLARVCEAGHE